MTTVEDITLILGDKYREIRPFREGGTRSVFLARWGPGGEERIIKVDKQSADSPRARRHVSRGCTTRNDLLALANISGAENHHLVRLCDYAETNGQTISVESFFQSENLEERVGKKPLSIAEFQKVFSQVLDGASYLSQAGIYHRDLKPSNILVSDGLDVRITDFANACRKESVVPKALPTLGGHLVTDPRLLGRWTGKERAYDEAAEVYAIGTDMLFALTGKYPVEYDVDTGTAKALLTGEGLLRDGKLDEQRHDNAIRAALASLPKDCRKFRDTIYKCLTLDEPRRYASVDDLVRDFSKACSPTLAQRAKKRWLELVAAGLLAVVPAVALGGWGAALTPNTAQTYPVAAEWDLTEAEVKNNYVELTPTAYVADRKMDRFYPTESWLQADPGQTIRVNVMAQCIPTRSLAKRDFRLPGKVYLNGYPGKEFYIRTYNPSDWVDAEWGPVDVNEFYECKLPDTEGPRTYEIVVELYPPHLKETDPLNITGDGLFPNFAAQGMVLCQKRIPIVVGDPAESIKYTGAQINGLYNDHLRLYRADGKYEQVAKKGRTFDVEIPELGYNTRTEPDASLSNTDYVKLDLPKGSTTGQLTMRLACRKDGKLLYQTFIPLRRELHERGAYCTWELAIPTRDFAEKSEKYRLDK